MNGVFKCCLKPFNNLICVSCLNVFHSSCLARKKGHTTVFGHRICCSSECEAEYQENESKADAYKDQLDKYKVELTQKDSYIRRQRKLSLDLESSAREIEDDYLEQLRVYKRKLSELKVKLSELEGENKTLGETLDRCINDLELANNKIKDLGEARNGLLSTIETLSEENKILSDLVERSVVCGKCRSSRAAEMMASMCTQTDGIDPALGAGPIMTGRGSEDLGGGHRRLDCINSNVLVLTDGYGKYLYSFLKNQMSDCALLRIVSKPGASFREISKTSECYIDDLSNNGFVIVIVNPNNLPVFSRDLAYLANKCFSNRM